MTTSIAPTPTIADVARLFIRHPLRWLLPAVVVATCASAFALQTGIQAPVLSLLPLVIMLALPLAVIGGLLSPACYIEHSFPAVLYLAARYPDDIEAALIANTNAGGDNCHRGAVLGTLLGAALGVAAIPERWIQGLTAYAELEAEIERFIACFGQNDL